MTAQIDATGVTALTLNMRRNGMAAISVDFENGGVCTPAAAAARARPPRSAAPGSPVRATRLEI